MVKNECLCSAEAMHSYIFWNYSPSCKLFSWDPIETPKFYIAKSGFDNSHVLLYNHNVSE